MLKYIFFDIFKLGFDWLAAAASQSELDPEFHINWHGS